MTLYPYVGPKRLAEMALHAPPDTPIRSRADVQAWARASRQDSHDGCVIATYSIDDAGVMRRRYIADSNDLSPPASVLLNTATAITTRRRRPPRRSAPRRG